MEEQVEIEAFLSGYLKNMDNDGQMVLLHTAMLPECSWIFTCEISISGQLQQSLKKGKERTVTNSTKHFHNVFCILFLKVKLQETDILWNDRC